MCPQGHLLPMVQQWCLLSLWHALVLCRSRVAAAFDGVVSLGRTVAPDSAATFHGAMLFAWLCLICHVCSTFLFAHHRYVFSLVLNRVPSKVGLCRCCV